MSNCYLIDPEDHFEYEDREELREEDREIGCAGRLSDEPQDNDEIPF